MIKFPNDDILPVVEITARCDLCTKVIYSTTKDIDQNNSNQKSPYICETYKIYCERCYMIPLLKIKELVSILEEYQNEIEKKEKRAKRVMNRRIKDDRNKLEEINNEFY